MFITFVALSLPWSEDGRAYPSQSEVFQSLCINNNQPADTQKMIYELSVPQTQQHLTQHMLLHSSLLLPGYGSLFSSTTHLVVASCALSLNKLGQYPSGGCGRRIVKLVCRGGGGGYIVCEGDLVGVEREEDGAGEQDWRDCFVWCRWHTHTCQKGLHLLLPYVCTAFVCLSTSRCLCASLSVFNSECDSWEIFSSLPRRVFQNLMRICVPRKKINALFRMLKDCEGERLHVPTSWSFSSGFAKIEI